MDWLLFLYYFVLATIGGFIGATLFYQCSQLKLEKELAEVEKEKGNWKKS